MTKPKSMNVEEKKILDQIDCQIARLLDCSFVAEPGDYLSLLHTMRDYVEAHMWFDPNKDLPIPGQRVIACWDERFVGEAYTDNASTWFRHYGVDGNMLGACTGWQYLPEPAYKETAGTTKLGENRCK